MGLTEYKIVDAQQLNTKLAQWRVHDVKVVFTNGCFDLLHEGHLHTLQEAKQLGDRLVIGVNSNKSISGLKGNDRPVKDEVTRMKILAAFSFVDAVIMFEEPTPLELIRLVQPEVLVKGGDWDVTEIVGSEIVLKKGGLVTTIPTKEGFSTTNYIDKILKG